MTTRFFVRVVGAGVLLAAVAATAPAQPYDRNTTFTFNIPVAVPGVTLPAGSYMFRVATAPNVVQVLSPDGRTPYAMFFTHLAQRPDGIDAADVQFVETGPGVAPAIRTWWYPGTVGYEFIYPPEQARLLREGVRSPAR